MAAKPHNKQVNKSMRKPRFKPWLLDQNFRGFPGGAVVENLPANAAGHGFEPWSGKIPHAAEQLSP